MSELFLFIPRLLKRSTESKLVFVYIKLENKLSPCSKKNIFNLKFIIEIILFKFLIYINNYWNLKLLVVKWPLFIIIIATLKPCLNYSIEFVASLYIVRSTENQVTPTYIKSLATKSMSHTEQAGILPVHLNHRRMTHDLRKSQFNFSIPCK